MFAKFPEKSLEKIKENFVLPCEKSVYFDGSLKAQMHGDSHKYVKIYFDQTKPNLLSTPIRQVLKLRVIIQPILCGTFCHDKYLL